MCGVLIGIRTGFSRNHEHCWSWFCRLRTDNKMCCIGQYVAVGRVKWCVTLVLLSISALYSSEGNKRFCDLFCSLARALRPLSTHTLVLSWTVVLG